MWRVVLYVAQHTFGLPQPVLLGNTRIFLTLSPSQWQKNNKTLAGANSRIKNVNIPVAKTRSHVYADWAGMPFDFKRQENYRSLKQDLWPNKTQRANKVMAYAGMLFTQSLAHSHLNFPLAGRKETHNTETLEFVVHASKQKITLM